LQSSHEPLLSSYRFKTAAAGGADVAALRELKSAQVAIVYRILLVFFGVPPTTFDWTYVDEKGKYNAVAGLTPLRFFNEYVQFPLSRQVSVIHDPRHPYNKSYTVERLGNVVGGQRGRIKYLNLPIDELKTYAMRMINAGMPVWFGCDVGKEFHRKVSRP
jgi:bleomycin hydrolase